MDFLLSPYPEGRLWCAGLFLAAALLGGLGLLARGGRGEGRAAFLLTTLAFAAWEVLVLLALLDHLRSNTADPGLALALVLVLLVVPFALACTLLVTGDGRLACAACALMGLGALAFPGGAPGAWLVGAALLALFALGFALLGTSYWSDPLGSAAGVAALLTVGGLTAVPAGDTLAGGFRGAVNAVLNGDVGVAEPEWLYLLLLVPLLVGLSFRSLAGLGPVRRWVALGLRCLLIVLLTLALAEVHLRHANRTLTVLFVWDRSQSVPEEPERDAQGRVVGDLRERRVLRFINDAVARRGPRRLNDRTGLIVFGRWPRVELPPAVVPQLRLRKLESEIDGSYTDIAAALKLALASFPEGTGKRIVLIGDGNENLGSAEEQARIARQSGVEIDVVPVTAARGNQDEVLVEPLQAPTLVEKGGRLRLHVVVRSFNPDVVVGKLTLWKSGLAVRAGPDQALPEAADKLVQEATVRLQKGPNAFVFEEPAVQGEAFTYEARFVPQHVEDARGKVLRRGLPGDRFENNAAGVTVLARGERTVLLVETNPGGHPKLVERLKQARGGKDGKRLRVLSVRPEQLPQDPTQLMQFLGQIDSLILANLPAESLTEPQQAAIRSSVHDQGTGLVMVGGTQSYGAGSWQGTEIEKALPVTCDLKSTEVEGKAGLVLIMHASEMAEGNRWQKEVAKLAIKKLSPVDKVGLLYYGGGVDNQGHTWHIPFKQVGGDRSWMLRKLDSLNPGDMPDARPSLQMAYDALTRDRTLSNRLVIFISDGDHWQPPKDLLDKMKAAKVPCTTVCVTTHGPGAVEQMKYVALKTGGRWYNVTKGTDLPGIYMKETRLISKSFIHNEKFVPELCERAGPSEGLPSPLPPLHGFVRTSARPGPLVHVPITRTEKGESLPILAYWHYGLGKVVAYTSDAEAPAKTAWDFAWAQSPMHAQFWQQVVDWSLRAVDSGKNLALTTEVRGDRVRVTVRTRDEKGRPLTDLELRGGVTGPAVKGGGAGRPPLKFVQKGVGVYEAELKAEDVGSYFLNVQAVRRRSVPGKGGKAEAVEEVVDSVRGGVTVPYSPEFADMEGNPSLLERLRELTGGKAYADDAESLERAVRANDVFRPASERSRSLQSVWFWLVFLTGVALFFDVAARRLSLDPHKLAVAARGAWERLRGVGAPAGAPAFLERLQSRKAQVGESLEKGKASRRYEGGPAPAAPPPGAGEVPLAPPPAPRPAAPPAARKEEDEAGDFASRLLRAKKRALEERDRDKGKP
jgi:uncharacterized membrane protein